MGANFNLAKGLGKCKKENLQHDYIQLKYYRRGLQFSYGLNIKIDLKYWDNKRKTVRLSHDFPQGKAIRNKMKLYADKVEQFVFEIENSGKRLTAKALREKMDQFFQPKDPEDKGTKERVELLEYLDYFIEERNKGSHSQKTKAKSNYQRLQSNLLSYQKHTRSNLTFDQINKRFIESFKNYCFNEKQHSINYAAKLIKTLRTILRESNAEGLHENRYYESGNFALKSKQTESIYTSLEELEMFHRFEINDERLDHVRRRYVMACFSGGVRYGDMIQVSKDQIEKISGHKYFSFITEKTKQRVRIPLHPYVEEICEYYNWDLPPIISNQKMNDYLKEVGEAVGLTQKVTLLRSKAGKMVEITKPKYQWLSTKIARKSFATNCYLAGWPIRLIMSITGHTTEKMLRVYIAAKSLEYAKMISEGNFLSELRYKAEKANELIL